MDYEKYSPLPAVSPEAHLSNTERSSRASRRRASRRDCASSANLMAGQEDENVVVYPSPTDGSLRQMGAEAPSCEFAPGVSGQSGSANSGIIRCDAIDFAAEVTRHEVITNEEIILHDVMDAVPSCELVIEEANDDLFTFEEMPHVSEPQKQRVDKAIQFDEESLGLKTVYADKAVGTFIRSKCTSSQTALVWKDVSTLHLSIRNLRGEVRALKNKVAVITKKLDSSKVASFEKQLSEEEDKCKFYTSFSIQQLALLKTFLKDELEGNLKYWGAQYSSDTTVDDQDTTKYSKRKNCKFTPYQELLLTLVRLRVGLLEEDLACRFDVSVSFVSRVTTTWIQIMYTKFYSLKEEMFASQFAIKNNLPARFQRFKNIRVIIDCAEIFCQTPSNFEQQGNCYSEYKSHSTFKFLIGCAPNGAVTFISHSFEGSKSDRAIVEESGLIEMLEEGDMVLADRGFTITDLTDKQGAVLKIPAFLKGRDKLSPQEEIATKDMQLTEFSSNMW